MSESEEYTDYTEVDESLATVNRAMNMVETAVESFETQFTTHTEQFVYSTKFASINKTSEYKKTVSLAEECDCNNKELEDQVDCLEKWSLQQENKYLKLRENVLVLSEKLKYFEKETEIRREMFSNIIKFLQKQEEILETNTKHEKGVILSQIYNLNQDLEAQCIVPQLKEKKQILASLTNNHAN